MLLFVRLIAKLSKIRALITFSTNSTNWLQIFGHLCSPWLLMRTKPPFPFNLWHKDVKKCGVGWKQVFLSGRNKVLSSIWKSVEQLLQFKVQSKTGDSVKGSSVKQNVKVWSKDRIQCGSKRRCDPGNHPSCQLRICSPFNNAQYPYNPPPI